jgi:SAM-dependent methyltransferase
MTDAPQTWHYGLIARDWAEFSEPDLDELAFYRGLIEQDGQPALDLGCGTGRLLLPLLRAGVDADGSDISADMLAYCSEHAAREGLTPRLYQQAMHELHLPRTYRTIFICDSFGIGGNRAQDAEALRRCHHHLAPGGVLAFSLELPYSVPPEHWVNWLPEQRCNFPTPWSPAGERRRLANGDELEDRMRLVDLDPLEQRTILQIRSTLWRGEQRVAEEEHTMVTTRYFRNEVLLMLNQAGFGDVTVYGGYTDVVAAAEDTFLVFVARKDR